MARISRKQAGGHLCIAHNGVPPIVSKRVQLTVQCEYLPRKKSKYTQHQKLPCSLAVKARWEGGGGNLIVPAQSAPLAMLRSNDF